MQTHPRLIFASGGGGAEISIALNSEAELSAYGHARLDITASSDGFAGSARAWVESGDLTAFAAALRKMSETVSGSAELQSISAGDISPGCRRGGYLALKFISVGGAARVTSSGTALSSALRLNLRKSKEPRGSFRSSSSSIIELAM